MTKVAVIGGGVAGLQAGVFTAKSGEETVVFDNGESLVKNTSNIQNLICHCSIGGQEILEKGRRKLENFGGELSEQEVVEVERKEDGFLIKSEEGERKADFIVVASAGDLSYVKGLEVEFEDGVEGPYMMDRHLVTDESNKAAEGVYAAGLANSWEYQTSTALGDGAKAAVNLLSEIRGEPYTDHDT
ncbi:MAG: FAD-dependent oxidoreductase [Candidatus Nanohaloarchaea archaeon]